MGKFFKKAFSLDRLMGVAVLAGFVALYIIGPYPVEYLRLKTFDYYQQLKPRAIPPREQQPAVIIDLDETSLSEIGQWPWPRVTIAQMVQNLMQLGASLVAFDVVFAEPDRMNPSSVAQTLPGLDPETRGKIAKLPSGDQIFGQVIKRSRVVLGQAGYWDEVPQKPSPPVPSSVGIRTSVPGIDGKKILAKYLPNFKSLVRNVPEIEPMAAGRGIFSLVPEPDGIVRRVPTLFMYKGETYPSLSVEMLRVATGRQTLAILVGPVGIEQMKVTPRFQIPTDNLGRVWPYFSKSDKSKYVPAKDVLAGTVDPSRIKGRMAIVGTSAVGLLDIRATPTEPIIPGVEVHVQMIETAASQQYLDRPGIINGAEISLLVVGGLLMIILVPVIGAKWTLLLFLTVAGGAIGTSWYLFTEKRLLFDAGYAVICILLLYTMLTYTGYAKEEAQRRQVRSAFGFYLSPAMVEKLAEDPSGLKLGGETRNMTMLFCDVRGFTSISELFDAQGLTKLINKLLTPLTDAILRLQGTVDKYMGDCIMAFWNAPLDDPDHARHACKAALEMNALMIPLNAQLEAEAKEEGRKHIPLKIGIGVNSGDVVVGNMGSDQRFDYSVLGDNVNLASRLEGQCKTYGVDTVIGENTEAKVRDFAVLELDLIKVKGKSAAVRVFTVLGDEQVAITPEFLALKKQHEGMLAAYREQKWETAKLKLNAARAKMNGFKMGDFYDIYAERIAEFEANPPGEGWDGVYTATSK